MSATHTDGTTSDVATPEAVLRAAERLRIAAQTGVPCEPVRDLLGVEDLSDAYAVQQYNVDLDMASGRRVIGRKIGLTSPAVQAQLGVDQPDFGTLFADMLYAEGVEIPFGRLLQPKAEAEVALILDEDLDHERHSVLDIINATAYALPALEIVDSRIADWNIRATDTIADNGSSALLVIGSQPRSLADVDVRGIEMSMTKNGSAASSGSGAACLGNPLNAAIWLADQLALLGTPLRAGDIVLTGALGPMVNVEPGDSVVADLGALGSVGASFSAA